MAKKFFVVDTNVFMGSSDVVTGFDDNIVVITPMVLQELDRHKCDRGEEGYNVRESARQIEAIISDPDRRTDRERFFKTGANGGLLYLYDGTDAWLLPDKYRSDIGDNQILNDVKTLMMSADVDAPVILVTNDVLMRINAVNLGISVQSYRNIQVVSSERYTGRRTLMVSDELVAELRTQYANMDNESFGEFGVFIDGYAEIPGDLHENEYLILNSNNSDKGVIGSYSGGKIYPVNIQYNPFGVIAHNIGQNLAMSALMAPVEQLPLVILEGRAGTAKTFLSLACGLDGVYDSNSFTGKRYRRMRNNSYSKLVYTRPNQLADNDHGYLPGDLLDKLSPLMGPAYDNLEQLVSGGGNEDPEQVRLHVEDMFESGVVEAMSMAYMRGRSIKDAFLIVDEAQNCTRGQIYDIITRAGEGTKVVLCGDANQIDNPRLDRRNNGLIYAIDRMKDSPLCAQVTFDGENECERSALAAEATRRFS